MLFPQAIPPVTANLLHAMRKPETDDVIAESLRNRTARQQSRGSQNPANRRCKAKSRLRGLLVGGIADTARRLGLQGAPGRVDHASRDENQEVALLAILVVATE